MSSLYLTVLPRLCVEKNSEVWSGLSWREYLALTAMGVGRKSIGTHARYFLFLHLSKETRGQ